MPRAIDYGPPTIGGKVNVMDLARTDPQSMAKPAWLRQEMLIGTHNRQAAQEDEEEARRKAEEQAKRDALAKAGGGGGQARDLDQQGDTNPAHYPARLIEGAPLPPSYFGDYFGVHAQDQFPAPRRSAAPGTQVADNGRPWTGG